MNVVLLYYVFYLVWCYFWFGNQIYANCWIIRLDMCMWRFNMGQIWEWTRSIGALLEYASICLIMNVWPLNSYLTKVEYTHKIVDIFKKVEEKKNHITCNLKKSCLLPLLFWIDYCGDSWIIWSFLNKLLKYNICNWIFKLVHNFFSKSLVAKLKHTLVWRRYVLRVWIRTLIYQTFMHTFQQLNYFFF